MGAEVFAMRARTIGTVVAWWRSLAAEIFVAGGHPQRAACHASVEFEMPRAGAFGARSKSMAIRSTLSHRWPKLISPIRAVAEAVTFALGKGTIEVPLRSEFPARCEILAVAEAARAVPGFDQAPASGLLAALWWGLLLTIAAQSCVWCSRPATLRALVCADIARAAAFAVTRTTWAGAVAIAARCCFGCAFRRSGPAFTEFSIARSAAPGLIAVAAGIVSGPRGPVAHFSITWATAFGAACVRLTGAIA
jgi:hypothetical protein